MLDDFWGLVSEPRLRPQARLEIEALYDGVDFSEPLTRARFEAFFGLCDWYKVR
jgi:hypothetical protein